MATSISISAASGYPTETSMRVNVEFTVTYAGSYNTEFEVHKGTASGTVVDEATGSTFTLSAGGSKSGIYKTFTGLSPGTKYTIVCYLCNASTEVRLLSDSLTFWTEESYEQEITYHSGSSTYTQTISGSGKLKTGSIFTGPSGYTFWGWATKTKTNSIVYEAGETYITDSNDDMDLYAVWYVFISNAVTFYYGVDMAYTSTRDLEGWAYNTSSTKQSSFAEPIKSPAISSDITALGRTFSPIGWKDDTTADSDIIAAGGEYIEDVSSTSYYALYENDDGINVYYDANGGSGSMTSSTVLGSLYYNTAGNNSTITVVPRSCTFTPPSGMQFAGWATKATGTIVSYLKTAYHCTFYAQWGSSSRPDDWSWSGYLTLSGTKTAYNMYAGGQPPIVKQSDGSYYAYYMGAAEWNSFVERIEEFADYLGISLNSSDISGARATAGYAMRKSQAQCVVNMLSDLDPPTSPPSVSNAIKVSFFTEIMKSLNSIP